MHLGIGNHLQKRIQYPILANANESPIIATTGKVCYSKQVRLFSQTINDVYEIE